jgi:ribose 5-phosphate isomerase B
VNSNQKRIAIGSDHIGYPLKEEIKTYLGELGHAVQDFGVHSTERTDYPLFAEKVTSAICSQQADLGILICGTGIGMAITANKVKGIRAAACSEPYSAMLSRQHNDTNVLTFGSRVVGSELARMIVKAWLEAEFEGGRHAARLEIISQIEAGLQARPQSGEPAEDEQLTRTRAKIAEIGRMVFERHLTDSAGGNISVRVGDRVCITPRYSGSKRRWHLRLNEVLVSDLAGNKIDGDGEISREAKVHYRLYQEFPDATAVLHCHARNAMTFVAAAQPIEPILEATLKFGTIPVASFAPAHSEKLADSIANAMQGKDEAIRKYAAAVIAPWHGLFTVGKDLDAAFDLTERIDTNAYCLLMGRLLPYGEQNDAFSLQAKLAEAIKSFNDRHANS